MLFFFSSRRRHTRLTCDWSSDVCSSDLAAVRGIAKRQHVTAMRVNPGGAAVQDPKHPTSIHFAYPRSDYQIEVYDPSPARALQLVLSGQITPLESAKGPTQ